LLINSSSRTDTYPAISVRGNDHATQHEASVSQVSAEQIFYLMQRGLSEAEADELVASTASSTTSPRNSPWNTASN